MPFINTLIQECQLLNPDPDDEQAEDEDVEFETAIDENSMTPGGDFDFSGAEWYTTETPDDEVRLSEEGRANLERIVGNLNLGKETSLFWV